MEIERLDALSLCPWTDPGSHFCKHPPATTTIAAEIDTAPIQERLELGQGIRKPVNRADCKRRRNHGNDRSDSASISSVITRMEHACARREEKMPYIRLLRNLQLVLGSMQPSATGSDPCSRPPRRRPQECG